jgi:hypothetical protein
VSVTVHTTEVFETFYFHPVSPLVLIQTQIGLQFYSRPFSSSSAAAAATSPTVIPPYFAFHAYAVCFDTKADVTGSDGQGSAMMGGEACSYC